jgi:hypothetical protein
MSRGFNGEDLVAVAGGYSKGLEVWNPDDGTFKVLTEDFPASNDMFRLKTLPNINVTSVFFFTRAPRLAREPWTFDFDFPITLPMSHSGYPTLVFLSVYLFKSKLLIY